MSPFDGGQCNAVLFDVDGTLVDTAPDMVAVLQSMQAELGLAPVAYDLGRSHVSNGAVGLLRLGFPDADDERIEALRLEYLERYARSVCEASRLFAGLDDLLDELDSGDIAWGVVTNKPHALTMPLLAGLGIAERAACVVSGDTLETRKPDPAPLIHACRVAGMTAPRTIYVGDASRDIEAGRAAGLVTIAAAYGYVTGDDDPTNWGADALAEDTDQLGKIVRKAVNLGA